MNESHLKKMHNSLGFLPEPGPQVVGECLEEINRLRAALIKLRDCDWVITLPDRMDAVRAIAREALSE